MLAHARDRLLAEIEAGAHRPGCECMCGISGDARVIAGLIKELRATVAEIEALPKAKEASVSADLRARVASSWGSVA